MGPEFQLMLDLAQFIVKTETGRQPNGLAKPQHGWGCGCGTAQEQTDQTSASIGNRSVRLYFAFARLDVLRPL